MLRIGLTGGIGSGKTTVANEFAALGVPVIDTDIIARDIVNHDQSVLSKIIDHFGHDIVDDKGLLNRAKLRELIFTDLKNKQWLESLLHPLIRQEAKRQTQNITSDYCIIVIPLLIETNAYELVDRILVVDCDEQIQLARVQQRDNNERALIEKMIQAQATRQQRVTHAHDVLLNDQDINTLKNQVHTLHQHYLQLAHT